MALSNWEGRLFLVPMSALMRLVEELGAHLRVGVLLLDGVFVFLLRTVHDVLIHGWVARVCITHELC